ncbi:MAG TPA: winged helix-turn-helix domain-containing protein [Thermoanaerobaculia bacterium]|nr:winged helix-turn-helix domain-containing protein [Thermoanaerobaculia bacterium]
MNAAPPPLRFGDFELQLDSGELRRAGEPVKLQPQPAKILEVLASRSGEVVSREEIRQAVWGDAFVDLDASLNFSIKEIRRALGDSATSPSFIETIPRRGYRFLQPVEKGPREPVPGRDARLPAAPPRPAVLRRLSKVGVGLGLLVLLTLLVALRLRPVAQRLAVGPLVCQSQNLADQQICSGLTAALTDELTRQLSRDIDVIAPFSTRAFSGRKPAEMTGGLRENVVLRGEAKPSAQGLHLAVRLVRSGGKEKLWSGSFDTELRDAPLVYGKIAREVARALRLSPPKIPPVRPKPSPAAYQAYLRGLSFWHQMEYDTAAEQFQNAVILDPGFAPAWAELALARVESEAEVAPTEAAARRALELDPNLAEAHVAVAQVRFRHELDWKGAGQEYLAGLALDPGDANAHSAYSHYLMALGRRAEAMAEMQRARELNPASMELGATVTWYLVLDRRYEEVLRETPGILELYSLNAPVTTWGAKSGKYSALDSYLTSAMMLGDREAALQAAKGGEEIIAGRQAAARLHTLEELWQAREREFQTYSPYFRAKNAMMLGEGSRVLDLLTSDCNPEGWAFPYAAVEPLFDPLHKDPRWPKVLDCLKLPADAPARRSLR